MIVKETPSLRSDKLEVVFLPVSAMRLRVLFGESDRSACRKNMTCVCICGFRPHGNKRSMDAMTWKKSVRTRVPGRRISYLESGSGKGRLALLGEGTDGSAHVLLVVPRFVVCSVVWNLQSSDSEGPRGCETQLLLRDSLMNGDLRDWCCRPRNLPCRVPCVQYTRLRNDAQISGEE
jgi:hypothetical protein